MERIFLVLLLLCFGGGPAALAAKSVFDDVTSGQPICYGREYGLADMAAAPRQRVQKIQAKLSKIKRYNNQTVLSLEITLRGAKNTYKNYRSFFNCDSKAHCQIDCDGGSADLRMAGDGRLVIKNNDFVIEGACGGKVDGEEQRQVLKAFTGADDYFRLVRLPVEFCQNVTSYPN